MTTPTNRSTLEPAESALLSIPGRAFLAVLLGSAGLIHLVMVPVHMDQSVLEGTTFVLAGWAQLVLALVIALRPSRQALVATFAATMTMIGAWTISRVWGLPYGAHQGHPEEAAFVDVVAVGIEAATILVAALLLWRPTIGARWDARALVAGSVAPVLLLVLTTTAIASPSARQHGHGDHGNAEAAAGHGDDLHHDDHAHEDQAAVDDLGWSLLDNGHQHEKGEVPLDPRTQRLLDEQLTGTLELVRKYPTISAAEAAGYRRAGPFTPGLGTHFIGGEMRMITNGTVSPDEISGPVLIYDGVDPDSPIAGFMYMAIGEDEPEGFIGPNDHWHWHTNVCIVMNDGVVDTPLGADREVTKAQCDEYGGMLIDSTGWMVHVWTVPGYENPDGLFAELNPKLTCPDGTYHAMPLEEVGYRTSQCLSAA
jgi:hypothetical protein